MRSETGWPESVPIHDADINLYDETRRVFGDRGRFKDAWVAVCNCLSEHEESHGYTDDNREILNFKAADVWNAAMAQLGYTEIYTVLGVKGGA
jgi:hypothetical protein